jgi:hypothetical protein
MFITHKSFLVSAAFLTGALALWVAAVPTWVSVGTSFWLAAGAVGAAAVLVAKVRAAGPTRSIAHVLYDTENQPGSER